MNIIVYLFFKSFILKLSVWNLFFFLTVIQKQHSL